MTYISMSFIYFVVLVLIVVSILPKPWMKQAVILAGNVFFSLQTGKSTFLVMLMIVSIVYVVGILIDRGYKAYYELEDLVPVPERIARLAAYKKKYMAILILACGIILLVFFYVKVAKYFGWTECGFRSFSFGRTVIIPLGLSYFSLSLLGYLLDIYEGRIRAERNFILFLIAVTYFPHIVQGPICKYNETVEKIRAIPPFNYERAAYGLQIMCWGYLKKLVFSDTIAIYTSAVFSDYLVYDCLHVLLAIILYAVQFYTDFSGCMDIVAGISQVIGIELDINFRRPFLSCSAREFWQRWHITLGSWFKNYVYMPVATSKVFKRITKRARKRNKRYGQILAVSVPSLIVWVCTGIWHGTGWNYLLWGLYWGTIIIVSEVLEDFWDNVKKKYGITDDTYGYRLFCIIRTFFIYCTGLVIVSVGGTLKEVYCFVKTVINKAVSPNTANLSISLPINETQLRIIVIGTILLVVIELIQEHLHEKGVSIRCLIAKLKLPLRWTIYFVAVAVLLIYGRFGSGFSADTFIYAGF